MAALGNGGLIPQSRGLSETLELMKSLQGLQPMLKRWIFQTNYIVKERRLLPEQAKDEEIDLTPQQKFGNE